MGKRCNIESVMCKGCLVSRKGCASKLSLVRGNYCGVAGQMQCIPTDAVQGRVKRMKFEERETRVIRFVRGLPSAGGALSG